jgi:predicted phosphoadenosine phosphosulfate sulfurtransferase
MLPCVQYVPESNLKKGCNGWFSGIYYSQMQVCNPWKQLSTDSTLMYHQVYEYITAIAVSKIK